MTIYIIRQVINAGCLLIFYSVTKHVAESFSMAYCYTAASRAGTRISGVYFTGGVRYLKAGPGLA